MIALAAPTVVFSSLVEVAGAPIAGLERQALLVPLGTINVLSALVAAFTVLVILDLDTGWLIGSQVLVGALAVVLYLVVLSRVVEVHPLIPISVPLRRRIVSYSTAMTITATLGLIVWQRFEVFVLGHYRPSAEVAYYSIGYAMATTLQQVLPVAFMTSLFPSVSRAYASRDTEASRTAYQRAVRYTTMAVAPVAVGGSLLSVAAIHVFYGTEFDRAAMCLAVLLFSAGAQRLSHASIDTLLASDHERLMVWFTAGSAVVNTALAFGLIPVSVGRGQPAATTQCLAVVAGHQFVRRIQGFRFPTGAFLRTVAANVPVLCIVGGVVLLINNDVLTLIIGALLVLPTYAFGLVVTRALDTTERQHLHNAGRRIFS